VDRKSGESVTHFTSQPGQRPTRTKSDRTVVPAAVVLAVVAVISLSSAMSQTTPPSPAPEISATETLKKGDEAYHRKDYAGAMHWYRQAADQGVDEAQNSIGRLYANGWGVTQDYRKAMHWFRQAAHQGYAGAGYNIGLLFEHGWDVAQDYGEAMRWHREAADQGNGPAQNNIGWLYQDGRGVAQDYGEAMRWYLKAADQGISLRNAISDGCTITVAV
jgi:TPR repeat protein